MASTFTFAVALVTTLGLAACTVAAQPDPSAGALAVPPGGYVFTCAEDFRVGVRALADSVVLTLPRRDVTLPQVVSASGVKYEAGDVLFWTKGDEARLEIGDRVHDSCTGVAAESPWEAARLRGATFRAIGQEPGWSLDVHPDRLRYTGDYGSTLVVTPAPEPSRIDSATIVYDARTEAHALRVTIREARCVDTMSGIDFTHDVTVVVDGRELHGCDQALGEQVIDGIEWQLVALGGTPAVPGGMHGGPHLRFNVESPQVTGSTGCNRLSGSLERNGASLRFGPLVTTRMACADPALAQQEQEFVRALERVDRFSRDGAELILYAGDTPVARFSAARAGL